MLVLPLLLALAGVCAPAAMAQGDADRQAWQLLRLDPGALLGGNTQVATAPGMRVQGVPRRPNFVLGLGARQRIVGGAGNDQLGVRGRAGRIHGGAGHDLIHGGPGDDILVGGPGRDLIHGGPGHDQLVGGPGADRFVDEGGATRIHTGRGRYEIDVSDGGGDDSIVCGAGSTGRIEADRGDRIAPSCRSARVTYRASAPPAARTAQIPVTGDGSNEKPFVARCFPAGIDCQVKAFAARSLNGLWANEYVPAYRCPPENPYLLKRSLAPFATMLPFGVAVEGLGPVGVSIAGMSTTAVAGSTWHYVTGTQTGSGLSSATNWTLGSASYKVILHCTSDATRSYPLDGPGYY